MTCESHASERRPARDLAVLAGKAVGALFVFAVLIQISWNMFVPKLFAVTALHMHEALGLALFAAAVAFGLRLAIGHARRG